MGRKIEMLGYKYNRLRIVAEMPYRSKKGDYMYLCLCDCGNERIVRGDSLRNGHIVSCGCYNRELLEKSRLKHGHNKTGETSTEYNIWHGMIQRCTNQNNDSYANYGGRDIIVCKRWRYFQNFLSDMGSRPSNQHSLDIINVNGNYEPLNCRWASFYEQARNKRNNIWAEYNGERMVLGDWAKYLGAKYSVLVTMMKRGKPFDKVVEFYLDKKAKQVV